MRQEGITIFVSYAHEDRDLLKELDKHLSLLKYEKLIDVWYDRDISAGSEWQREIDRHLDTAQIILLLISPDFLGSSYCYSVEMYRAMERYQAGEACVVPIILRPVYWQGSLFGNLQALPTEAKPVKSSHWYDQDDAFLDIVGGIRKILETLISKDQTTNYLSMQQKFSPKSGLSNKTVAKRTTSIPNIGIAFQKTKEQWLEEGTSDFQAKQFEEAIIAYERAIQIDPVYIDAYLHRGHTYCALKEYEKAFVDYNHAISLNSEYAHSYMIRGDLYYSLREYQKAIEDYGQAIILNPTDASIYVKRGNVNVMLGEYRYAIDDYDYALIIDQGNTSIQLLRKEAYRLKQKTKNQWLEEGKAHHQARENSKALDDFDRAIQLDPGYVEAYTNRGLTYYSMGKRSKALDDFVQAIQLDPRDHQAYYGRGLVYYIGNEWEKAVADLTLAIQINSNNSNIGYYNLRGLVYEALSDKYKAYADYQHVLTIDRDNMGAQYGLRKLKERWNL